ncbi:MAG: ribonuclease III, partial [Ktedonobacterales bacterium]
MTSGPDAATRDPAELEHALGLRFADRATLLRALTHHSACPQTRQSDSYDRLEFLGDALIGVAVVERIFLDAPEANEGEMTALKSEVVSRRALARIGLRLELDRYVRVDTASLRTFNERTRESLAADALEALVAAIHVDQGREAANAFIAREILPIIPAVKATLKMNNPKGELQEHILRQTGDLPRYDLLETAGLENDRRYTVGVFAGERLLARGTGSSIKEASKEAARVALRGEETP